MINEERRKEHEQIGYGEYEQAMSRAPVSFTASAELERKHNKNSSEDRCSRAIDRACKANRPRQQGSWNQESAVDQNLTFGGHAARNGREHGHTRPGIVVCAIECERPEMRWRPEKDDEKQNERLQTYVSSGRRPSDNRGQRAGSTTDDDVLTRGALQPSRVNNGIEKDRAAEQRRCGQVGRKSKKQDCAGGEGKSEHKCLDLRNLATGDRPHRRPGHERIDIGVIPHIKGASGASTRGNRENGDERVE